MAEIVSEELKHKILEYLGTVDKARNRDISKAIAEEKALVDKAIAALGNEDKIEYLYLGTSYVKLKGK